jgi:hypothetical protein
MRIALAESTRPNLGPRWAPFLLVGAQLVTSLVAGATTPKAVSQTATLSVAWAWGGTSVGVAEGATVEFARSFSVTRPLAPGRYSTARTGRVIRALPPMTAGQGRPPSRIAR